MEKSMYRGSEQEALGRDDRETEADEQSKRFIEESDAIEREELKRRQSCEKSERDRKKHASRSKN